MLDPRAADPRYVEPDPEPDAIRRDSRVPFLAALVWAAFLVAAWKSGLGIGFAAGSVVVAALWVLTRR